MTSPRCERSPAGPVGGFRRGGAGAGLIGLLLVLLVGLLIYAVSSGGGGSYTDQLVESRKTGMEVRQNITTNQLVILIAAYREERGKLPTTPADLDSPGAFNDPWGKEMTFTCKEGPTGTVVMFRSAGPDGQAGTEDDVTREDTLPY